MEGKEAVEGGGNVAILSGKIMRQVGTAHLEALRGEGGLRVLPNHARSKFYLERKGPNQMKVSPFQRLVR